MVRKIFPFLFFPSFLWFLSPPSPGSFLPLPLLPPIFPVMTYVVFQLPLESVALPEIQF